MTNDKQRTRGRTPNLVMTVYRWLVTIEEALQLWSLQKVGRVGQQMRHLLLLS
jgi:hypothetical protein